MKKANYYLISGACLALLASPALADQGPVLKIENFIGTVDVVTGDYEEIRITDADGAPYRELDAGITIDADETIRNINCRQNSMSIDIGIGNWGWKKRSGVYKDLNEYPKVKIKAPQNTHVVIENSVIFGEIGTIGSADIEVRSCGDLKLNDVNGDLTLSISGSGDVSMGDAGPATVSVSGSGDLEGENFASIELDVSGSGDVEIADIDGFADIESSGSGDVTVGRINGGLEYSGSGSSDFEADYIDGDLSVRASGSGDIDIDDGEVETLYIAASGATDIDFGGSAVDAEARATGASDVTIRRPSGKLKTYDSGAGDVNVRG